MSTLQGYFGNRRPRATLLALLALALLSWVMLFTPRTPTPELEPPRAFESARLREQRLARQQFKEANTKAHKDMILYSRGGGHTCDYNLRHLSRALEGYRFDHSTYPARLSQLVPAYIDHLPNCPREGKETYSAGYDVSTYGYKCSLHCSQCFSDRNKLQFDSAKGLDYAAGE